MASGSDKFRKSYSFLQKTLSSGIDDNDTTLTPNNVTNIPTDTGVTFIIDRVDSNGNLTPTLREIVSGHVSGSTIASMTRGQHGTTAQSHSAGAVIEFVNAGNIHNDMVDGILAEHNQDGSHGDVTAETLSVGDVTFANTVKGWIETGESWSYSAWDSTYKTGTITVPTDSTTKYSLGMKIRITQSTGGTKYGFITEVNATTLKVYFGTDYTLNNEAISTPLYSTSKAPYGFPLNPAKWTVKVTDTANNTQTTPTSTTWYNPGSLSISIPIGTWDVDYQATVYVDDTSVTSVEVYSTLSTANNSQSDAEMSAFKYMAGASGTLANFDTFSRSRQLTITSGAAYYLNVKTDAVGIANIGVRGDRGTVVIRAVCRYL